MTTFAAQDPQTILSREANVEFKQRIVETNGIHMRVAEAGEGPLVVLCHGFPESWDSWRHQLAALAEAGFHAVAPDMRGYGGTDRPEAIDQYSLLHLVGDIVGLVEALGAPTAVVAGHDWGAPVAWHAALMRPDRFRGVIGLSVPFRPRAAARPTTLMPQTPDAQFYQLYFQEPGVAEAELDRDPRTTIRQLLLGASGDAGRGGAVRAGDGSDGRAGGGERRAVGMVPRGGAFLDFKGVPSALPAWLKETDIDFYAAEFARTGFRGGLNWYRNIDRNWELLSAYKGARVTVPALYVAGDRDMVVRIPGMYRTIASLKDSVSRLQKSIMLPGCGHWTQQERPAEVNVAILEFLRTLDS